MEQWPRLLTRVPALGPCTRLGWLMKRYVKGRSVGRISWILKQPGSRSCTSQQQQAPHGLPSRPGQ